MVVCIIVMEEISLEEYLIVLIFVVDYDFSEIFGLEFLVGCDFDVVFGVDYLSFFLINE